jgi:hypothetical protein
MMMRLARKDRANDPIEKPLIEIETKMKEIKLRAIPVV